MTFCPSARAPCVWDYGLASITVFLIFRSRIAFYPAHVPGWIAEDFFFIVLFACVVEAQESVACSYDCESWRGGERFD